MRAIIIIFLLFVASGIMTPKIYAQEVNKQSYFGEIVQIVEEEREIFGETRQAVIYKIEIETEEGVQQIEIIEQGINTIENVVYEVGDQIVVEATKFQTTTTYTISDFQRTTPLIVLFVFFVILVILVAGKQGVFSLLGLGISYVVIFFVVLKPILIGTDPLLVAILAALIIIPINYYLSHGFNSKTTYAAMSTFVTLVLVGILSLIFADQAKLTGFTSDEAGFIVVFTEGLVNIKDVLLAGIIIGALGILDDITISQSSIAHQLKHAKPKIEFQELFSRTMTVGRDHIASLVNTLILVYTSTSLPLLLLFLQNQKSFIYTLNSEVVAEEVIIMLLTSLGLIIAVPVSTLISCYFVDKKDAKNIQTDSHFHIH